jgi:hypothetical protein
MVKLGFVGLRVIAVASLIAFSAGCSDDATGPGSNDPFDVQQSNEDFGAVQAAFDANIDVADDMSFVLPVLENLGPPARLFDRVEIPSEPVVLGMARTARMTMGSASLVLPLLPSDVLGVTFEWSDLESAYVPTARTGAPTNGLRVIVYDRTVTPFDEVGFVDVTDESDPAADRLHVHMEKDGLTRLDYTVALTQSTSSVSAAISGFITDGVQRVDFEVTESAEQTASGATIEIGYSLSLAGQPLSVSFTSTVDIGEFITAGLTTTFVNGANTLVLDMSQDAAGTLDGTVTWNGDVVMTITGSGEAEPIFLGPEGEELTVAEAQAIAEMFELTEEGLFFLLANLAFLGSGLA